jgi:beta-glucanase (GH16 family)
MEWLPDRIIFYFDDIPFYQCYNNSTFPTHTQYVVVDQQVDASVGVPYLNEAFLPDSMSIDYFRYYELNTSTCTQNISITTQSQFNSFYGFYNNIDIGNSSSNISMTSGQNKVIRNSGNVTITGVFSIPLGATFSIINTQCF